MKITVWMGAALMLALAGCSLASGTHGDNSDAADSPLVSAYSETDDITAEMQSAEQFAQNAIYKAHPTRMLATTLSREVQVVAGLNYRFRIGMGGGGDAYKTVYTVVVYRDLDGGMQVTELSEDKP